MLDLHALKGQDLQALRPEELGLLAAQMLAQLGEQAQCIEQQSEHIGQQAERISALDQQVSSQAQGIKWRDAKIESITFQLARLKAWRFGARTEAMTAEQRALFDETYAADEASLRQQLDELKGSTPEGGTDEEAAKDQKRRKPKREPLPAHLPRVEQRIEPEDTHCPTPECGKPMVRVGEDISERLDIIPAQFFVQRQIRGKWACKCCQVLMQEPAAAQVFDNALPTPGLQAHVAVSHFVDHLPYYRIEQINGRSNVHTPRSTLAGWNGKTGAQLMPMFEAHRSFVLGAAVLHADETPVPLLDPGAGKTKRAYMWTYARGAFDPLAGVVYDFCLGRGSKYPMEFLQGWAGTLVVDAYAGYDSVVAQPGRQVAYCLAHARRAFDELIKTSTAASPVAAEAVRRIAWLYRIEAEVRSLDREERLRIRHERSRPLWDELHLWLQLERTRVPDGSSIAKAIDYSLNRWAGLGQFLLDGDVPIDNNSCENRIRPVVLGRRNWLFIGSQLAGERAAIVMSLLQSARLNGHEPWAYLKDVLARLPTQLNSRIEELLPHNWQVPH
jgi:transposase